MDNNVPIDGHEVVAEYLKEKERIEAEEAYKLGLRAYKDGDYKSAIDYFIKAAFKGNTEAQFSLGAMYHFGYGCKSDPEKALCYYQMAHLGGRYNPNDENLYQQLLACETKEAFDEIAAQIEAAKQSRVSTEPTR